MATIETVNTYSDVEVTIREYPIETHPRQNWEFANWNSRYDGTGIDYIPGYAEYFDSDTVLYAKWEKSNCTITFNPNGGNEPSFTTKQVKQGSPVGELPTSIMPKADGFAGMEFDGWWTDSTGGTRVTETEGGNVTDGKSEITLYAHWLGVIHYENVGGVQIDGNGIASWFYNTRYLRTVEKFDFSGDFMIVMCGQVKPAVGIDGTVWPTWQDIFSGVGEEGYGNALLDFGMNSKSKANWEIAHWDGYERAVGTIDWNSTFTCVNDVYQPVYFGVRRDSGRIECQLSTDGQTWMHDRLYINGQYQDYGEQGNYIPGYFTLGADLDDANSLWYGNIHLNECYLVQNNSSQQNQPCGKYVLRPA